MSDKIGKPPAALVTDRRTLARTGLAGAALAAAPLGRSRAQAKTPGLYKAIYDSGYGEGRAFAEQMASRGVATAAITGDITALWYHDLYHRWKKAPAAIAGLTDPRALFCLEILANDAGLRLAFRSEVKQSPRGVLEHRAVGPASLAETAALVTEAASWGANMARLAAACPLPAGEVVSASQACMPPASPDAYELVAWVLAPRARA